MKTTAHKRPVITDMRTLRANKQAEHLRQAAINLDNAIRGLTAMGITVLSFAGGETALPLVRVEFSRACHKLAPEWMCEKITTAPGKRLQVMEVAYCNCRVVWQREIRYPVEEKDNTLAILKANRERQAGRRV